MEKLRCGAETVARENSGKKRLGKCVLVGAAAALIASAIVMSSMPAQAYSPPSMVDNLRSYTGEDFVELTWGPSWSTSGYNSSWSESYRIYRGIDGGNLTLYETKEWTGFTDTNVTIGTVYSYTIVAFNTYGDGPGRSIEAHPRPGPHVVSFSPTGVKDCDRFTATIEWSAPNDTTGVVGYRIYPGYGWPVNFTADARNGTIELGGWGPHMLWISTVYDDGRQVYDRPVIINGPMCEGGGFFTIVDIAVMALPIVAAGAVLTIALVMINRRKRGKKRI